MKNYILSALSLIIGLIPIKAYKLEHPCLLHTQEDFEYVRQHIKETPYSSALTKLKNSAYAKTSYTPSPVEYLARLDANNWSQLNSRWENAGIAHLWYSGIHNNYTNFMRDAAAAYQLALLYQIEGNKSAAAAAKNIIVKWAEKNKGILRNKDGEIIDPNEKLIMFQPYQMAVAVEMLRDYNGWEKTDEFKKAVKWMDDSFYGLCHEHLEMQNSTGGGHYWMNWDLASMTTVLALGILTDNEKYIDEAIDYYKGKGGGPGNILKGVTALHEDEDSEEILGQGNELGRDQGHNTLCAAVLGTFCQMALKIGEDLFAYDDYRAVAFAEYVAKYNLALEKFYPDPMQDFSSMKTGETDRDFEYSTSTFPFCEYTYGDGGTMTEISTASRGQVRPGWDYWTGYCNSNGISAIYSNKLAERIRPDGGGGQYSQNSGGFDQIGFSTLMGYRNLEHAQNEDNPGFSLVVLPVADTQIRKGNKSDYGGNSNMEIYYTFTENEDRDKEFYGLMRFELPDISLDEDLELSEAKLRMVCVQNKQDKNMALYHYDNNFKENTTFEVEEPYVRTALGNEPIVVFSANGQDVRAMWDKGIEKEYRRTEAWTTYVDILDYLKSEMANGEKTFRFLLSKLKPTTEAMRFATREAIAIVNNEGFSFASKNLVPHLILSFSEKSKSEESSVNSLIDDSVDSDSAVYYNLQGMQVKNPQKREIYIEKTGNRVKKIVFID